MYNYDAADNKAPWVSDASVRSGIRSIVVGDGAASIGSYAFYSCVNAAGITVPDSIISIGEGAFKQCAGLTGITLPEGITEIGSHTFSGCASLEEIVIPGGVDSIGESCFADCIALDAVTFPAGCTTLGKSVFSGCYGLESIVLPDGLTDVPEAAFHLCSALKTVVFPGVENIGKKAFYGCSALESIELTRSIRSIGNLAYASCTALLDVNYYGEESDWAEVSLGTSCFPEQAEIHFLGRPVSITEQPPEIWHAADGKLATLSLTAEGRDLTYQWYYSKPGWTGWAAVHADSGKTDSYQLTTLARHDGYRYKCVVSSGSASVTSRIVTLQVLSIVAQPQDTVAAAGSPAEFSVTAVNAASYRWEYLETNEHGEEFFWPMTSWDGIDPPTIQVNTTVYRNGMKYRCVVKDAEGNALITEPACLWVMACFEGQLKGKKVQIDKTATFSIKAYGKDLTYLWQYSRDEGNTWGSWSTKKKMTVVATESRAGYLFRCIVTDAFGNQAVSNAARLAVVPVFTRNPKPQHCCVGETAVFTAEAKGKDLEYQWYYKKDGGTWSRWGKGKSISVAVTAGRDQYHFMCKVTDPYGTTASSDMVKLTVFPEITSQPTSKSGKAGDTVTFSVTATGVGLNYQWLYSKDGGRSWKNWGSKRTISVGVTSGRNGYRFRCIVTDAHGRTLVSDTVKLTVK